MKLFLSQQCAQKLGLQAAQKDLRGARFERFERLERFELF
jgi:hypothetical protein